MIAPPAGLLQTPSCARRFGDRGGQRPGHGPGMLGRHGSGRVGLVICRPRWRPDLPLRGLRSGTHLIVCAAGPLRFRLRPLRPRRGAGDLRPRVCRWMRRPRLPGRRPVGFQLRAFAGQQPFGALFGPPVPNHDQPCGDAARWGRVSGPGCLHHSPRTPRTCRTPGSGHGSAGVPTRRRHGSGRFKLRQRLAGSTRMWL